MPDFGVDIFQPDFTPNGIVLLSNNGLGNKGIPIRCDHLVIVFCINGEGHRRINHHRFQITVGSAHIILPGQIHSFSNTTSDFEIYVLLIDPSFLARFNLPTAVLDSLLQVDTDCVPNIKLNSQEFIIWRTIFEQLNYELKTKEKFTDDIIATQVFNLLWQVKRKLIHPTKLNIRTNRQQDLLANFKKLIESHFQNKKTVQEYAELLYITPKHLSETIKAITNHTALYYIHERIIHEAEYLLVYTDLSVKEIANTLHFENPSHFGRFFRQKKSLTPLKYRAIHK